MGSYTGPAVVVTEESDEQVAVWAWLGSSVDLGTGLERWGGQLQAPVAGALWLAFMAGWANLALERGSSDFRFESYGEQELCEIRGLGPPPF